MNDHTFSIEDKSRLLDGHSSTTTCSSNRSFAGMYLWGPALSCWKLNVPSLNPSYLTFLCKRRKWPEPFKVLPSLTRTRSPIIEIISQAITSNPPWNITLFRKYFSGSTSPFATRTRQRLPFSEQSLLSSEKQTSMKPFYPPPPSGLSPL